MTKLFKSPYYLFIRIVKYYIKRSESRTLTLSGIAIYCNSIVATAPPNTYCNTF